MGGAHHPLLGFLGVMSAKNTAVNLLILTTFLSFLLYRRSSKVPTVPWAKLGNAHPVRDLRRRRGVVIFYGIYGYFVEAIVRIGSRCYQVLSVLFAMVAVTTIDVLMMRGAALDRRDPLGDDRHRRSQYVLIFLAVTFTWLMGLMGFVRSGLRQHWHVYGVMRDTSPDAFTPTLGFATNVISVGVLLFFVLDRPRLLARRPRREGGARGRSRPRGARPGRRQRPGPA